MKYTLAVRDGFSAAHRLVGTGGRCENLHGHNFKVEMTVSGGNLDDSGMLIDFTDLKAVLKGILEGLDHTDLNKHAAFTGKSPSSEVIAGYVWQRAVEALDGRGIEVAAVTVSESETASSTFEP